MLNTDTNGFQSSHNLPPQAEQSAGCATSDNDSHTHGSISTTNNALDKTIANALDKTIDNQVSAPAPHGEIKEWISLVTQLQNYDVSFAIYRLPQHSQIHMLIDLAPELFTSWAELGERSGFIIAPFDLHSDHPIILIRPERYFSDISEAVTGLTKLLPELALSQTPKPQQHILPPWANLTLTEQQQSYQESFEKIQAGLQQGCRKLVLSRAMAIDCPHDNNIAACFMRACQMYPNMMVTLSSTPKSGTWLGSTPETLIKGISATEATNNANFWHTMSLAGTMANEPNLVPVEKWSNKNRHEQHIVTEFLSQQLTPWSNEISFKGPECVRAGHLLHLRTEINFSLKDKRQLSNILNRIHPTPAVCGMPKDLAYEVIRKAEHYDRSYYAGAIGLYGVDSCFVQDQGVAKEQGCPCPITKDSGIEEEWVKECSSQDKEARQDVAEQKQNNLQLVDNLGDSQACTNYKHTQLFVNLRCMQFIGAEQAICYAGGGILPESDVDSEFEETQNKMQTMRRLFEQQ